MIVTAELYLKENVDEHLTIQPLSESSHLSVSLRETYNFYEMTILDTQCILLELVDEMPGIDELVKHVKQIGKLTKLPSVLYCKTISRYRRKSLIDNRIAFVIEDGQMYLPFLALDLKKAQENIEEKKNRFTASAQVAFIFFLYRDETAVNTTEFAEACGLNIMTASRALTDLYHAGLLTFKISGKTGRSKEYRRIPHPEFFRRGRDYLKTPVNKIIFTTTIPADAVTAGLDALAEISMINPPGHPVMAMDKKNLHDEVLEIITNRDVIRDTKLVELELWDYDPRLFSAGQHVDLLSLFASLREEWDERVSQALAEVLRGESWYTD